MKLNALFFPLALLCVALPVRADRNPDFDDDAKPILKMQPHLLDYVRHNFEVRDTGIARIPGDDDRPPQPPFIFKARPRGSSGAFFITLLIQPGPEGRILKVVDPSRAGGRPPGMDAAPSGHAYAGPSGSGYAGPSGPGDGGAPSPGYAGPNSPGYPPYGGSYGGSYGGGPAGGPYWSGAQVPPPESGPAGNPPPDTASAPPAMEPAQAPDAPSAPAVPSAHAPTAPAQSSPSQPTADTPSGPISSDGSVGSLPPPPSNSPGLAPPPDPAPAQ